MSPRCASVALLFAVAAGTSVASTGDDGSRDASERMTPAQLQVEQAKSDRQRDAAREENARLRRRIEALERRNAVSIARKTELDARLAEVRERLATLQAARGD